MTSTLWEAYTVTVQRLTGQGPTGPIRSTPSPLAADIQGGVRLVVTPDGREVPAQVTIRHSGASVPVGSLVTLPDGAVREVISRVTWDGGGAWMPIDHEELACA